MSIAAANRQARQLARYRALSAPGRTLSVFESAELEDLDRQFGQTQLHLTMPKSTAAPLAKSIAAPQAGELIQTAPATRLLPSPWNRKVFPEPTILEMRDSIQAHGIIQPIIVRAIEYRAKPPEIGNGWHIDYRTGEDWKPAGHHPNKAISEPAHALMLLREEADKIIASLPLYEIVAGERRWRGAQRVAPDYAIPFILRVYTDRAALEVQKIENLQREDLDPIEEAHGLQQMISEFGYTLDDLITKLGKQKSTIYARLKLAKLCDAGIKLFRAGTFSESVAVRFARIPDPQLQARALTEAAKHWSVQNANWSDRAVAEFIEAHFMKQLKGAPFDPKNPDLVPVELNQNESAQGLDQNSRRLLGGACTDCPMRAGNLPDFDPKAGRADMCLHPTCYRAKADAAFKLKGETIVAKGGQVADPAKCFSQHGGFKSDSPFEEVTDRAWEFNPLKKGAGSPTWAQLASQLKVPVSIVQRPDTGEHITIVEKTAIKEAARKAGLKFDSGAASGADSAARKAAAKKTRDAAELRRLQMAAVVDAAVADKGDAPLAFIQLVTRRLTSEASDDTCRFIAARRKLDVAKHKPQYGGGHRPAVAALGREAVSWAECRGIITEILAGTWTGYSGQTDPLKSFAEVFKVTLPTKLSAEKAKAPAPKNASATVKKPTKLLIPEARARIAAKLKARWAKQAAAKKGASK